MPEKPSVRIIYHPAPTPRADGSVREPAPVRLPANLSQAAAWLRRRLALSALDGAARYSGTPLPLDAATRAAVESVTRVAAARPARHAAPSGLMASLAEMINEEEESELPYADPLSTPPVDPAVIAAQAADDPFGALLGERPAPEEERASEDPFKGLLG